MDFITLSHTHTVKKGYWYSLPCPDVCHYPYSAWPGWLGTGKSLTFFYSAFTKSPSTSHPPPSSSHQLPQTQSHTLIIWGPFKATSFCLVHHHCIGGHFIAIYTTFFRVHKNYRNACCIGRSIPIYILQQKIIKGKRKHYITFVFSL
jgi:hypothetical protein